MFQNLYDLSKFVQITLSSMQTPKLLVPQSLQSMMNDKVNEHLSMSTCQ